MNKAQFSMITTEDINYLFEDLWPMMHAAEHHHQHCMAIFPSIKACFKRHADDYDELLESLAALDGIGLTIASGLIWCADTENAVPFDKYTMTWCLRKEILRTEKITGGRYHSACVKVFDYIESSRQLEDVEDFIREALKEGEGYPTLIAPR